VQNNVAEIGRQGLIVHGIELHLYFFSYSYFEMILLGGEGFRQHAECRCAWKVGLHLAQFVLCII